MPVVWRGMRMADGRPEVGRAGNLLGVRIGPAPGDAIPENDSLVQPGTGGMSISPSLDTLPAHRVPRRLRGKLPERPGCERAKPTSLLDNGRRSVCGRSDR